MEKTPSRLSNGEGTAVLYQVACSDLIVEVNWERSRKSLRCAVNYTLLLTLIIRLCFRLRWCANHPSRVPPPRIAEHRRITRGRRTKRLVVEPESRWPLQWHPSPSPIRCRSPFASHLSQDITLVRHALFRPRTAPPFTFPSSEQAVPQSLLQGSFPRALPPLDGHQRQRYFDIVRSYIHSLIFWMGRADLAPISARLHRAQW